MFDQLLATIGHALDEAHIPYMVIGGQAVLLYGDPRLPAAYRGDDSQVLDSMAFPINYQVVFLCLSLGGSRLRYHPLQHEKPEPPRPDIRPSLGGQCRARLPRAGRVSRYA